MFITMNEDALMTREEVATLLGISPESVRKTMHRYGITERRGYPRSEVEGLRRPGRGARTDLAKTTEPTAPTGPTRPE
jgi:hypothetical protein